MVLVKYNTATKAAKTTRIILSVIPMFFFICVLFIVFYRSYVIRISLLVFATNYPSCSFHDIKNELIINYFKTLLWQTKLVLGALVLAMALKPPAISEKFLKPRACKMEAAIILR
jgi:hypothetical protein